MLKQTKLKSDTRNTNHYLYNPCQFFFFLLTLFCPFLSIQENHRTSKSLGNAKYWTTRLFSICYLFYVSSFGKRADHLNCYKHYRMLFFPEISFVYCTIGTVFKVPASSSVREARITRAPGLHIGMIQDSCKRQIHAYRRTTPCRKVLRHRSRDLRRTDSKNSSLSFYIHEPHDATTAIVHRETSDQFCDEQKHKNHLKQLT